MPSDDKFDALSTRLEALSAELAQLRQRVEELERQGAVPNPIIPRPVAAPAIQPPTITSATSSPTNAGLKLLNRSGALTLFIGIIFFFKYAVDNQWIGAAGRVALGVLLGLALLGAGEWLRKRAQIVFAQGLTACGIATLYISVYAASDYYHLIGAFAAFLGFVAISAVAVWLSLKHADAFLAAIGYLSGIAAPGLFRAMDPNFCSASAWSWFGFLYLLLAGALGLIQARGQQKNFLIPLFAAASASQAFWLINPNHPLVCVLFFLAVAALHFRPPGKAVTGSEAYVMGHLFVLLAGVRFLFFWFENVTMPEARRSLLSETESVLLGIYGAALLLSAVLRKSAPDRILGLAFLGLVIAKLYVVDVWVLTRFYRITAFVVLGCLLLASSFVYSRWKQRITS